VSVRVETTNDGCSAKFCQAQVCGNLVGYKTPEVHYTNGEIRGGSSFAVADRKQHELLWSPAAEE